jgi:hypothetical protein
MGARTRRRLFLLIAVSLPYLISQQTESAISFIPVDTTTGDIVSGAMRGLIYGRGLRILLRDSMSESIPANWTQYLAETELADVLASQQDTLVSSIFAGSGAVAMLPDFLGYGESYQVDRPFLVKPFYARSYVLVGHFLRKYASDTAYIV